MGFVKKFIIEEQKNLIKTNINKTLSKFKKRHSQIIFNLP